jgi:flagellar biosynthesis protein FliR
VTASLPDLIVAAVMVFCRIGTCIALLPGFASARVPARVRLYIAIAVTLALLPALWPELQRTLAGEATEALVRHGAIEVMIGISLGFAARIFFAAFEFMTTAAAQFLGFSGPPDVAIEDAAPLPPLAALITLTATLAVLTSDLHIVAVLALAGSYRHIPAFAGTDPGALLELATAASSQAFLLALQVASPFLAYGIVANVAFAVLNRLAPQVPVYFISVPFVIAGGLWLLLLGLGDVIGVFLARIETVLSATRP